MDDAQFERMLTRLLQTDRSAGTEAFRDELLARCLAVLNADARGRARTRSDLRIVELDDGELELLAAAGDASCNAGAPLPGSGGDVPGQPGSGV